MNYRWDWAIYFRPVSDADATYLDWLIAGLGWTVAVSLCAWLVALVVGVVVGTLRTAPNRWVARICTGYVELFRNIPLLVQMFLWFFVAPELLPLEWAIWIKQDLPAKEFVTAVVALGLFTSARVAEQVRSGIQSLPRGQFMAGRALGFTLPQTYRYVILPMAVRIIIPPLTSEFMNVFKNSSVAYAISVVELFSVARQMSEETARDIETLLAVTLLYFVCAFIANRVMAVIEKRVRVPGYMGGGK